MSANELGPVEDPEARTAHTDGEPSAEIALSGGVGGLDSGHRLISDTGEEAFGEDAADETDRFGTDEGLVTLVRGADGVYVPEDELGAGTVDIRRDSSGGAGSDQPSLWRPVDRAQPGGRGHLHMGPGRSIVAGVAAVTFTLAAATAYEATPTLVLPGHHQEARRAVRCALRSNLMLKHLPSKPSTRPVRRRMASLAYSKPHRKARTKCA